MNSSTFRLIGLILALLGSVAGATGASAAAAPPNGFLTLSNPETGVQLAAWCEGGKIISVAVIDSYGESDVVGAPIGAACSAETFAEAGFVPAFNLDPWDGWAIVSSAELDEGTYMAYTCTREGPVFAIKYVGHSLYTYEREGRCGPGVMPG